MLHFCLDLPSTSTASGHKYGPVLSGPSPLGLRRVHWGANHFNKRSIRLAGKLGFKDEGVKRHSGVAKGRIAEDCAPGRWGDGSEFGSVSSWGSSITWEDWEGGVREHVDKLVRES
jgi:hypothetical protein